MLEDDRVIVIVDHAGRDSWGVVVVDNDDDDDADDVESIAISRASVCMTCLAASPSSERIEHSRTHSFPPLTLRDEIQCARRQLNLNHSELLQL